MSNKEHGKKDLYNRLVIRIIKGLDVALVSAAFAVCWYLYYAQRITAPFYRKGNYVIIALFAVIYYLIAHLYHGFLLHLQRISELTYSQIMAALCADGIMYVVMGLLGKRLPDILPYLLMLAVQICVIVLWCKYAHNWYLRKNKPKKTAIIWEEREHLEPLIKRYGMDTHFDIVKMPVAKDAVKDINGCLNDVEVVFLNGVHSAERNVILKECVDREIPAYVSPGVADVIMTGADRLHLFHQPFLFVHGYDPTPEYLAVKRLMDIVLSLAALVVLSPVMIVVAIIIKSDGGTAFYKQTRLTQYGKEFQVLKFRSMRMDAEKDGVARLSSGDNDPRITPIGRFIRKVRIDELPQLINILKGDMTIVGPRPERPEIARQYEDILPEFKFRLQAKCGLTGYAQVYGQYNTTPYDKLLMDLMYIANPSIFEDIKIILATVKILFMPESTEGVEEGHTTAIDMDALKREIEERTKNQ